MKAGNGEIVLESQGYESKDGAKKGIASIQANAPGADIVDLTMS
ncbi:YegP family protein [Nocardia salmonicida]